MTVAFVVEQLLRSCLFLFSAFSATHYDLLKLSFIPADVLVHLGTRVAFEPGYEIALSLF